jgi:hypothetical protein
MDHRLAIAGLAAALLLSAGPTARDAAAQTVNTDVSGAQKPHSERLQERLQEFREEEAQQADKKAYWQDLYRTALARERKAEAKLEAARAAWTRGRANNRLRGQEKAKALKELEMAEKELAVAREDVATIPARAQQAGALPGWLREVEQGPAAPPAAN